MQVITHELLLAACSAGGASVLTSVTELAPAAGPHAGVAPARFARGNSGTYAYETRHVGVGDERPSARTVVIIDSKQSAINRIEQALSTAIVEGDPLLGRTPRITVTYLGAEPVACYDLPHRAFDGHIRAGSIDGVPTTSVAAYRALRDATSANARSLLETSPFSLAGGAWDSTRKSHQVRFRSAITGEIIGVLSDQSDQGKEAPLRGAARRDEIAPSVRLQGADMQKILDDQRDELSVKNVESITKEIGEVKTGTISGSRLGLGAIPPSLDGLGFVACERIIRSHVLSFAALRQLRFGLGVEGDAAARALLAALALAALARSDAELSIRANCDLVEVGPPVVRLDQRYGKVLEISPITIQIADDILADAISAAEQHGVRWQGQVMSVVGNPLIAQGIATDTEDQ